MSLVVTDDLTVRAAAIALIHAAFFGEKMSFHEFVDFCYGKRVIAVVDADGVIVAASYMFRLRATIASPLWALDYFCTTPVVAGNGIYIYRRVLSFIASAMPEVVCVVSGTGNGGSPVNEMLRQVGPHQERMLDAPFGTPVFLFKIEDYRND